MLDSVFGKTIRDHWLGMFVGTFGIWLMLVFAMAVYRDLDLSFYYEMPEAYLEAFGISGAIRGVGGIAYGAIMNVTGALILGGIAIAVGSAAVAGEERSGTIGVLLGNPVGRRHVILSKIAAMAALIVIAVQLLWLGGYAAPWLLNIDIAGVDVGALSVHLLAVTLFFGLVPQAIGAWSGDRTVAAGGGSAVMLGSWIAASVLPLVEEVDDLVRLSPWYYFNGSNPGASGTDWSHVAVLAGLSIAMIALSVVGFERRDLAEAGTHTSLLDRLRVTPATRWFADRLAGSVRVSGVTWKTLSEHQGLLTVVGLSMFLLGLMLGPVYTFLPEGYEDVFAEFPEALEVAVGGVNMATPTGFLQGEMYSIMLPAAFIGVLAVIGARALAGEEQVGTMDLLLAQPIARWRVVWAKLVAMVVYAVLLGVMTGGGVALGVVLADLDVELVNIVSITVLGTVLSLIFGAVALLLSAATGRVKPAAYGAASLAVLAYFTEVFLSLSDRFEDLATISPFHYYLAGEPLKNGMDWTNATILTAVFVILATSAIPLFGRRDIRG